MNNLDIHLNNLQETYDLTIAKTNIHGNYESEWTECFKNNCRKQTDNIFKNICKQSCKITYAQKAITDLGRISTNCSDTSNPRKCRESINKTIEMYNKKIIKAQELQVTLKNKIKT